MLLEKEGLVMASNELIVDDDYCKAMGAYFEKQGKEIDKLISDYISIIEEVRNKGITSGNVSNALNSYIIYVKKLNKQIGNLSNSNKTQIDKFLAHVDELDRYLF